MTRDAARQLEQQLRRRFPGGKIEVTRVFGGVEVEAGGGSGRVFMRTTDDSPLLALLGADPEHGDLPGPGRPDHAVPGPLEAAVAHRLPPRPHHRPRHPLTFRNGTVIPGLVPAGVAGVPA